MKLLTIPPKYQLNKKVVRLLTEIEANNTFINTIRVPLELEQNIRRQSLMRSGLFSARIEGNSLTSSEVQSFSDLDRKDQQKIEVANLYRMIEHINSDFSRKKKVITISDILRWQKRAMKNILAPEYLGKFRDAHEGIFDSSGNAIYHAPPPNHVESLTKELLKFTNGKKEKIIPIRAVLSHLVFEKIHPFVDGSGRVGRLLQMAILCSNGYGMKGLVCVEEIIDLNRSLYYNAIERSTGSNAQPFVELMLEFLRDASDKAKAELESKEKNQSELDLLPPRQKEIALIISDQRIVPFDSIQRRFLKISPRQLAYDLDALIKKGYVQKIGKTRGALYSASS